MSNIIGSKKTADILGVSIPTVTRWAKTGKLRAVHKEEGLRQPWLFDRRDVEALAAEEKKPATT